MTADELQRLARILSNSCWCRHYLHWNYPNHAPWEMAISCIEQTGADVETDLESRGFRSVTLNGRRYYVIPRTTEDGHPYHVEL